MATSRPTRRSLPGPAAGDAPAAPRARAAFRPRPPTRGAAGLSLLAIGSVLVATAGADLSEGPDVDLPAPPPPPPLDGGCMTGGTNQLNSQLGIEGPFELQNLCENTPPGDPGDLKGFAFPMPACLDGGIDRVFINFRQAVPGDPFFLYVWRDLNGLPADACGLQAYSAAHLIEIDGPFFSTYILCDLAIHLDAGERFWIGVIYRAIDDVFGPMWLIGRNARPGWVDQGYINRSGKPGDWVDLNDLGFGNRWGVIVAMTDECAPVPVESSSWGAVKALMAR